MNDLELASTDDLIAEIRRRHDASLIVLYRDLDAEKYSSVVYWSGGVMNALGMCDYAKEWVMSHRVRGRGTES